MTSVTSRKAIGGLQRRTILHFAAASGIAAVLPGCSTPARGPAVPLDRTTQATVLGVPNERFFPFYGTGPLEAEFTAATDRLRRAQGLGAKAILPEVQLLAVSGGGENGAFGAGLLCGWYLDEVFIRIRGMQHYLWRAVDQEGVVLDILVQSRRDARAATRSRSRGVIRLRTPKAICRQVGRPD
jgi:DDE domain